MVDSILTQKKVLFIIPSFFRGGMENMLINVANVISESESVTVYNLGSHDDKMVNRLSPNISYFASWTPCKNILHCGIKNFAKGNFRILPSSVWYRIHSPKYIHKKIVRDHFDTEIAFFVGEPIKIISGCVDPLINTVMWIHSDYRRSKGLFSCFFSKKKAIISFGRFRHIVCVSKNAKISFDELTGHRSSEVIYNYLPIREIELCAKEEMRGVIHDRFTIIAVGRLVWAKGFDRLLRAIVRLNKLQFKYQLVIVGDGVERTNLETIAEENKLTNVHFVGIQENPYPYIANSDMLVCTSRYEGYNLTVAEAIILGIPVMSTRCTGPTEILDDGKYGYIVDNTDEAIFCGLREILEDSSILSNYRILALERKKIFIENKIEMQLKETILRNGANEWH